MDRRSGVIAHLVSTQPQRPKVEVKIYFVRDQSRDDDERTLVGALRSIFPS
jgi:hypothetical protein